MDAQGVIDTATAANAAVLGNPQATEFIRGAVNGSYKVLINLKITEREALKRIVPFNVIFAGTKTVAHDHALIAALRELARDVYERVFRISKTTERTLVVGAAMREITQYNHNPNIHHYVYGGEAKDVDRIIRPALQEIAAKLKVKAAKVDRRVFLDHPSRQETDKLRPAAKRYTSMQAILKDYMECNRLPGTIHLEPVEANTIVFEDSIYNFDRAALVGIFNQTRAQVAYGYGMFPMELLFPDMPPNRWYEFATEGDYSRVTYRSGNSNGYYHKTEAWRTILDCPVIRHRGTSLAVEIICRLGCMMVFKLSRTHNPETIPRTLGLNEFEAFVRVLDIETMYCHVSKKLKSPLKYISVRENEFYDALDYLISLDEKSRNIVNCISYVRRRMGGMSLVTKELVAPWDLPKKDVMKFCIAVTIYASLLMGGCAQFVDPENYDFAGWWSKVKMRVVDWCRATLRDKSQFWFGILCEHRLHEEVLLSPANEVLQKGAVKARLHWRGTEGSLKATRDAILGVPRGTVDARLYLDFPNELDVPSCDVCLALHGELGDQKMICKQVDTSFHTFTLTESQLGAMKGLLLDTDQDPAGLADVKKRAQKNLPTAAFSHRCKVKYIRAGPGCGKSYIIRKLADEHDLVLAPFTKLKIDYERLEGKDEMGAKLLYNLEFKTQHRAMETRGKRRVFVDEFTSFPYEFLACVAYNNAAQEIFLVGDEKQTRIMEPSEGLYIGNYIDLALVDTHELLVNFRNPPDTVALLNKLFGYQMRAAKPYDGHPSITFTTVGQEIPATALQMCFARETALKITEDVKNTVRSNQGGTHPDVVLYATGQDGVLLDVPCLQVVGLSRHTNKLIVMTDNSEPAQKLKEYLDQGPEWSETFKEYITFPDEAVKVMETSDEVISRVLADVDSDTDRRGDTTEGDSDDDKRSVAQKVKTFAASVLCGAAACCLAGSCACLEGGQLPSGAVETPCAGTYMEMVNLPSGASGSSCPDSGLGTGSSDSGASTPVETEICASEAAQGLNASCGLKKTIKRNATLSQRVAKKVRRLISGKRKGSPATSSSDENRKQGTPPKVVRPRKLVRLVPEAELIPDSQSDDDDMAAEIFREIDARVERAKQSSEDEIAVDQSSRAAASGSVVWEDNRITRSVSDGELHYATEPALEDFASMSDGAVYPEVVPGMVEPAVFRREEAHVAIVDVHAVDTDTATQSDGAAESDLSPSDLDIRSVVANVFNESALGCSCARLRDVALTDNFRDHPTYTPFKIDQLLPWIQTHGEDFGKLCILGGAAKPGDRYCKMMTHAVRGAFTDVWSVDPRFAEDNPSRGLVRDRFQNVDTMETHTFFSDMWDPDSLGGNNHLLDVVKWYKDHTDEAQWGKFILVHKLTWTTTSTVHLAQAISQCKSYGFLRVMASGASSEYFVFLKDLTGSTLVPCCTIAQRVNGLYAHAEGCSDCLNGRLHVGTSPAFWKIPPFDNVRTNCKMDVTGTPWDVYRTATIRYTRFGQHPMNPKGKDQWNEQRHGRRTAGWFFSRYPNMSGRGRECTPGHGNPGTSSGWQLPVQSRLDVVDLVVGPVETEARQKFYQIVEFAMHAQTWMYDPRLGLREYGRVPMLPPLKTKALQTPKDAHLNAGELLSAMAIDDSATSWNWLSSQVVKGTFAKGKFKPDMAFAPVNARRHPVNTVEVYRSAGPGLGLHYSAKKSMQVLAVMETRYLNLQASFPFTPKEMQLAREIVDLWFEEHVRPMHGRPVMFSDEDIDLAYSAYMKDAASKGYASRYVGTKGDDGIEGRTVRFHLKTIFKPKAKADLYKVGQGISAWSVQTLAMYCSVFRLLTTMSLKVEKDHVITDAYWTEPQFMDYINKQFRTVPAVAKFGVTDGEMFDACQNNFTQELERHYLRRLGLSEEIIAHYYSFRAGYYLNAACVAGKAGTQKTSGEPGTLYNNGVVARTISNWLLRGDGPQVIIYKGDDFVKRQCSLTVDKEARAKLDTVCALKIRVSITPGAEFCGLVLEDGFMFPSITRKLNKIVAHRFRTYDHFCEYQAALRDWVSTVEGYGAERVIGHNAALQGTSYHHMAAQYDAIKSFSHINKKQYEGVFVLRCEPAAIPVRNAAGCLVLAEA